MFEQNTNKFDKFIDKMEPLLTAKRVLILLSIYPVDIEATSKWKKMARIVIPLACLFTTLCMIAACAAFIFKFISTNLPDCLYSFMIATLYINSMYIMLTAFAGRRKMSRIFEQLSEIYEDSKVFSFVSST